MDWRHHAACRDEDPDLFFPTGSTAPIGLELDRAKAVCAGCPVRQPCLQWAVLHDQPGGVWGGLTESERGVLRRRAAG